MDDVRLLELEVLCEAATPGPWDRTLEDACFGGPDDDYLVGTFGANSVANAAFIVAARTALPEALSALREAKAREEGLRRLLTDLRDWHAHTDEDANVVFERIADEFYKATGMLRPGKSESPERHHDPEERQRRFREWCQARHAALTERLRAALEPEVKP